MTVRAAFSLVAALIGAGVVVSACSYSTFVWEPSTDADPPFYRVWNGSKDFWIDRSGKRVRFESPPQANRSSALVPLQEGELYGFALGRKLVIAPRFLQARTFSEGRASVVLEGPCVPPGAGMCGGEILLPRSAIPRSVSPLDIQSGRWRPNAPACQYTFIDERGEPLGRPAFEDTRDFHGGMAAVLVGGLWGYVNRDLTLVVTPRFHSAGDFHEGLAAVGDATAFSYIDATGNRACCIDSTGRCAIPGSFAHAGRFFQGRANVLLGNNRLAYIDREGRIVYSWKPR